VLPLPKGKIDLYRSIAEKAGRIWKEHGALEYPECIGDDLDVKELVPFPELADAQPDETVVFTWIGFESREHRGQVNAKVMADPRIKEICDPVIRPLTSSVCPTAGSEFLSMLDDWSFQIRAQEPEFHCWKAALPYYHAEEKVMNSGSRILRADYDISAYRWAADHKGRLLEPEVTA
jgi:uncharacterized protein YbaA (DUF1428 family)